MHDKVEKAANGSPDDGSPVGAPGYDGLQDGLVDGGNEQVHSNDQAPRTNYYEQEHKLRSIDPKGR